MEELKQIKLLRKKLGWGQKELAERAEVSQSFIAKLESGKIEPTYSKAKRILEVLNKAEEKEELQAKDLMNKKIIYIGEEEKILLVIKKMKKYGISQIPIGNKNQVVGLISESVILNNWSENLARKEVKEIMKEVPPIVSLETPKKGVMDLLRVFPLVLVGKKGEIKGLISKSDLLENI